MPSPYDGYSQNDWAEITKRLVEEHPLQPHIIKEVALASWQALWQTRIGVGDLVIRLDEIDVPAIVVGYFFEKLFAKKLQAKYPEWRGGRSKEEKDIVYDPDSKFSVEIKTSGQLNTEIFGNRSYGQIAENKSLIKKEKSGYYITANFYKQNITLLRFGWLDYDDWKAQKAPTGQASGLVDEAYKYKLFTIPGDYILGAPVNLLCGVGKKAAADLAGEGIKTINELIHYREEKSLKAKTLIQKLHDSPNLWNPNIQSQGLVFIQCESILRNVYWTVNSAASSNNDN